MLAAETIDAFNIMCCGCPLPFWLLLAFSVLLIAR